MKRRGKAALCALLTVVGLLALVLSAAAAQKQILYFTAVNDTVMDLHDDTMPRMVNNTLYVPYTIFDPYSTNGVKLGVYSSYNRAKSTLMFYARSKVLIFDLDKNTAVFDNKPMEGKVIIRNSMVFVPLELICELFELEWSWIVMDRGYVIRVKSEDVVLSDRDFATAATYAVEVRYQQYMKNKAPEVSDPPEVTTPPVEESPSPTPVTPIPGDERTAEDAQVHLGIRMTDGEGFADILARLKEAGEYAVFFLSVEELAARDDDLRALLAAGHRIGLVPEGKGTEERLEELREGNRLLGKIARLETTLVLGDGLNRSERAELAETYSLWNTTLNAGSEDRTQKEQADRAVNGVEPDERCFLLLDDSRQSARALATVLTRLTEEGAEFRSTTAVTLRTR